MTNTMCLITAVVLIVVIGLSDISFVANNHEATVSCIDGVVYWTLESNNEEVMAIQIDQETKSVAKCAD